MSSALATGFSALADLGSIAYQHTLNQQSASQAYQRQKQLLHIQNQYAIDAEKRQNAYNTPLAQRTRIEQAGLNPDLLYGNGTLQNVQSSALTGGSAPSVSPAQPVDVTGVGSSVVDNALKIAQIRKLGSDKTATDLENQFNKETMNKRIEKVGLDNKWTTQQITNIQESTAKIQAEYTVLHQQQGLNNLDAKEREIRIKNLDAYMKRQIREYDDKHNLSKQELFQMQDSWELVKNGMLINNNQLDLNYESDKDYKDTERKLGVVGTVLGIASRFFR